MSFETFTLSKSAITRLFIIGIAAVVAGSVLVLAGAVSALAGGLIEIGGSTPIAVNLGVVNGTLVAIVVVGLLAIAGGTLAGVLSWLGALINTFQLEDKTWFGALLALGLLSFGFVA